MSLRSVTNLRSSLVEDENSDLLADSHKILNMWEEELDILNY
jgi:hypothetical protein